MDAHFHTGIDLLRGRLTIQYLVDGFYLHPLRVSGEDLVAAWTDGNERGNSSPPQLSDLGRVKKVKITSEDTVMVGGAGKRSEIDGRAQQIRNEIDITDSEYDREKLQERLAKLAGGVAQINVGAATETEMKERKALLEDAKAATQAALEEGIVPGGGVALIRSSKAIKNLKLEGDL